MRKRATMRWRRISGAPALALLTGLAFLGGTAACGDDGDRGDGRAAVDGREAVDREMDLAMEGDTGAAELRDEPRAEAPAPEAREPVRRPPAEPPASRPTTPSAPSRTPAEEPPAQAPETEAPSAVEEPPARAEPPEPVRETFTAPAGVTFRVELAEELGTGSSRPGDTFRAHLVDGINDGRLMVVPAESVLRGRVTAVQRSDDRGEAAVLKLAFDEVLVEGEWFPIEATIVEADPDTRGRSGTGEKAAKIGGGAAAGAILGRILGGDTKGAVIGAAVGAAAGTAVVLGTEDVDAVLPAGSILTLRLDAPLTVSVLR